jgi:hypothetical protein
MEHELAQLEKRLEEHIEKHDADYRKLLFWIITTLVALMGASGGFWIQYGNLESEVQHNAEEVNKIRDSFITEKDLIATVNLFDAKLRPISEDIQDIKRALNVK